MPKTVDTFLKTVLRSGLLDREQLQGTLRTAPSESRDDPEKVASFLVKYGKLSRYQAKKLLQGISAGLLLGHYEIQAPLGRGGMGCVYLAYNTQTRTHVALKVLPPKMAKAEERHLARFQREMELSQRVRHPHLALTYEVGCVHRIHYIALEYIPGVTLARLVAKEGPLPLARAARLFAEVASALDYAHNMSVIHRDLKPSNIMVTPNDHAKVLDLGLALIEGEIVQNEEDSMVIGGQGYIVGSVDYIAPEQTLDSTKLDGRADIYAMGCSLYYVLTGAPPFPGGTAKEKIKRHRRESPVFLNEKVRNIPEPFARYVFRMMAKLPEERPMNAAAVRQELLKWAGDSPQPMEQQGDRVYQQAVASLQAGDVSSDMLIAPLPPQIAEEEEGAAPSGLLSRLFRNLNRLPEIKKEYAWIGIALSGFWIVLLLVMMLILLLRQ